MKKETAINQKSTAVPSVSKRCKFNHKYLINLLLELFIPTFVAAIIILIWEVLQ